MHGNSEFKGFVLIPQDQSCRYMAVTPTASSTAESTTSNSFTTSISTSSSISSFSLPSTTNSPRSEGDTLKVEAFQIFIFATTLALIMNFIEK